MVVIDYCLLQGKLGSCGVRETGEVKNHNMVYYVYVIIICREGVETINANHLKATSD